MGNRNSRPQHRPSNPQGCNNSKPKAVRSDVPRRFFKRNERPATVYNPPTIDPPTTISLTEPKRVPQNNTPIPRTSSNISTNRVSSPPCDTTQIVECSDFRGGYHSKSKAVLSDAATHIVHSTSDPATVSNPPTIDSPPTTISLIAKPKTVPQHGNTQIPRTSSHISTSQPLAIRKRTETEEGSEQV
jgi:hypothetical protein